LIHSVTPDYCATTACLITRDGRLVFSSFTRRKTEKRRANMNLEELSFHSSILSTYIGSDVPQ